MFVYYIVIIMCERIIMDNKMIYTNIRRDDQSSLSKDKDNQYYSNYMLESVTTQHPNKALHTFGLVGGPVNNENYNNVVDLESQILGLNNKIKYTSKDNKVDKNIKNKLHEFQLIDFKETIV